MRGLLLLIGALSAMIVSVSAGAADGAAPQLDIATSKPGLPTVVIIATGGTIAEKASGSGGDVPALSGKALVDSVTGLADLANIAVVNFSDIDSSQMTPQMWARLSRTADAVLKRDDVAGVVITHGTDTMAEAAFMLDVTLVSDKPVVFTGAMNDAASVDRDGPANILNAVAQVLSPDAGRWGVTVTLNRYINSARDVRKSQTTNVQTFLSGEKGYLGYVFNQQVKRFNDRLHRVRLALPTDGAADLPNVPVISMYPGADGGFVRYAVDNGAEGLVVAGIGAGNVNAEVFEAIEYGLSRGVPIVISSAVYYGSVEPIYSDPGGGRTLADAGCILSGDLVGSKARLLLMVGLANFGADHKKLAALFDH